MSPVTASFCLIVCFLVCSSAAEENITAEHGQNVTLRCKSDNNNITVLKWIRPGLEPDDYVLYYRDGKFISEYQHRYYVNRVDLQDREMKDGDVSLNLKNVTTEDEGTYDCWVVHTKRRKRFILNNDPINSIYLKVLPPGDKDGGDKDGGGKDGGDEVGGDKDGGDKVEGDKDGGNKDGGDKDGGDKDRNSRGLRGVRGLIPLLAVLAPVGFLIYKRPSKKNPNLPVPPDEAAAELTLTTVS